MAKLNKRYSIKGVIDYNNRIIIENDKDLGEIEHKFDDIFVEFDNLEGTTLTLSYDEIIIPD